MIPSPRLPAPSFTVESKHVQTISFGSCRFFFENVGPTPLQYCWVSLVRVPPCHAGGSEPWREGKLIVH